MAITRKQRTSEKDWLDSISNIEKEVSRAALDELIDKTSETIRKTVKDRSAAFSWSGGKDSIVLAKVCQLAGVNDCVFVRCNLEYSQFVKWIENNKPTGCEVVNTGQDLVWLSKHQEMLFPQDSKTAGQWFKVVQHKGQELFYRNHNLDVILLGRRRADGNYVGSGSNIYTNAKGITRFSPLANWTHEQILACIHYYNLPLPPIYGWKNGYLCGTHPWPARQWTGNIANGWKEVCDIEPELVIEASKYIESAGEFLRGKTKEDFN